MQFFLRALLFAILIAPTALHAQQPKRADPPANGKTPAKVEGEPSLRIHPVPGGNAEAIAKLLQDIFPAPKTRIVAVGPNQIAAWADPQTHAELAKQQPLAPGVTVVIALDDMDSAKANAALKGMFGEPKNGGPFIESDGAHGLIVRGSAEQVDEVKQVLMKLGKTAGRFRVVTQGDSTRIITLDEGSAKTVGEALFQLYPRIRENPIKLVLPGDVGSDPPKKAPSQEKAPPEKKDPKIGKALPPVTIIAVGNRLIVTSEDRDALEVIEQMARILVSTEAGSDYEILRLKHAKAVDVARFLDEAFNGVKAGAGKMKAPERVEHIRVIAEPSTNSLLFRARPIDMLVIRDLLRSLDREPADR